MDLAFAGKRLARTVLTLQLTCAILLAFVYLLFVNPSSAISVVTGGTISVLTNLVFAYYSFRFSGASKNQEVLNSMRKGNKVKLLLTAMCFALLFQIPFYKNIEVIIGYCFVMLMQYPILILANRTRQRSMAQTDF